MSESKIEWTGSTWNPITGCTKISEGCRHCYAERMALRLQAMGVENYRDGFALRCHSTALNIPYSWKKPRTIFVNSMSDLFHEDVPLEFLKQIFDVMNNTPQHTYQILTKRGERLAQLYNHFTWSNNIWMGVTVENCNHVDRIDCLREVNAAIQFLSIEPLLGMIPDINLEGIDWVIVGGESGPGARKVEKEWIIDIRDQCCKWNIPFFFKQWGGVHKKENGRVLDGITWNEMPVIKPLKHKHDLVMV